MSKGLKWTDLQHGTRVDCYWHFNSTSGDYCWKPGTIFKYTTGDKKFIPDDGFGQCMLQPHRMDEIKLRLPKNNDQQI